MTTTVPPSLLSSESLTLVRAKNLLINGDMRIDQRNDGASIACTSSSVFAVDRFRCGMSGANGTAQRVACSLTGFPYMLRLTGTASTTTAWVGQRIESNNCTSLVGKTLTVQFRAASSNVTSLVVALKHATAADNFTSTTTIQSSNVTITSTLTYYTVSFTTALPAGAAYGLYIELSTGASLGTGTFEVTGFQLEVGSTATPFEYRPIGQELSLCQRYFERCGAIATGAAWAANNADAVGMAHPTGNFRMGLTFRTVKRAAPTFTTYDRTGASGKCSYYVAAWTDAGTLPVLSATAAAVYAGHNIASSVETQFTWTADAELG